MDDDRKSDIFLHARRISFKDSPAHKSCVERSIRKKRRHLIEIESHYSIQILREVEGLIPSGFILYRKTIIGAPILNDGLFIRARAEYESARGVRLHPVAPRGLKSVRNVVA